MKNYAGTNYTWTDKTTSIAEQVDGQWKLTHTFILFSNRDSIPKQKGCAYLECSYLTRCSSYAKKTTAKCQSISYLCISDGKLCRGTLECKDYSKELCESHPNLYSPYKCKN